MIGLGLAATDIEVTLCCNNNFSLFYLYLEIVYLGHMEVFFFIILKKPHTDLHVAKDIHGSTK